MVGQLQL